MTVLLFSLLPACSDYGLERDLPEPSDDWTTLTVPERYVHPDPVPRVEIEPSFHDFGNQDPWSRVTRPLTVTNVGNDVLEVTGLRYDTVTTELTFSANEQANGPLPWLLEPGESREVEVSYTPVDEASDTGTLIVASNDPVSPRADADQVGVGRFAGFTTGWYIVNDDTPYDLTSDATHRVDYDGDPDAYWYEPSGYHGLTDSTDPIADFAELHDYVLDRAGGPTVVTGPLSFFAASDLPDMMEGSFSYIMCDFWMDPSDDPTRYAIATGRVDDGVRVIVNGQILGELTYSQSGSWPLTAAVPGQINTLLVILMDNAMWEKYVYDLSFYKDGVMVSG